MVEVITVDFPRPERTEMESVDAYWRRHDEAVRRQTMVRRNDRTTWIAFAVVALASFLIGRGSTGRA